MSGPLQLARSSMRLSLRLTQRLMAADVLLFFAAMMMKLYLFDRFINVKNMRMNMDDMIVAVGTIALICFWTIWLPTRGRIVALVVLDVLLTLVLYSDLIYYRYFQDLISVPVLMQASQIDSLGGSISTLISAKDFVLMADWPFIIPFAVYAIWLGRHDLRETTASRTPLWRKAVLRISLSVILFVVGSNLVFGHINEVKRSGGGAVFTGNWWNLSLYNVTGVLGFHGYDIYRYANQNWLNDNKLSDEQIAQTKQWSESLGGVRKGLQSDSFFGAYEVSNVIMIQAEAFQNFMIGKSIGGQKITPNFDKLAAESAYFNNFHHQAAQGRTSDADFLANCSLQPLTNGSVFIQYAQNTFDCLPKTLKSEGYSTSVFHAYEGGFWNRNTMYENMKYDTFYSKKHFTIDEPVGWSLGDKSFFRQSVDVMKEQQQPFYSFLITLSSHHPFTMPASYQTLDVGEFKGTIFGDYLQSIHYVDASLGALVEQLKAEGLWDKSIFLLYGDHDNSYKDWPVYEKFLGKPLSEVERDRILKQVPFLVHLPDNAAAGVHEQAGGQIDVTPTILHLLGVDTSKQHLAGLPLVTDKPVDSKLVVIRSGAFTNGKIYYFPSADGVPENGKCWDIAKNAIGDVNQCLPYVQTARDELNMSDRLVTHNLIADFNKEAAKAAGKK
ncbi:LTA synthase family protein [Paenibacillus sp. GCM10023252]|uniref:LTA synthase family protein n=1 Tax=Paenibacillus sp. GCM10023252 TaxID=3252649 RepID=UPI0036148DB2